MTVDIQTNPLPVAPVRSPPLTSTRLILLVLTLMFSGRAMTLAFVGDVGGSNMGAPPDAWLMPLLGDALIGISALPIAYLVWRGSGLFAWTTIIVWNAVAIWDALSAYVVHLSVPWPSFFMVQTFGASMFFAASAMHAVCIGLLVMPSSRREFLEGAR